MTRPHVKAWRRELWYMVLKEFWKSNSGAEGEAEQTWRGFLPGCCLPAAGLNVKIFLNHVTNTCLFAPFCGGAQGAPGGPPGPPPGGPHFPGGPPPHPPGGGTGPGPPGGPQGGNPHPPMPGGGAQLLGGPPGPLGPGPLPGPPEANSIL